MRKRERSRQTDSFVHTVDMAKLVTLRGLGEEVYKVVSIMFHPHDAKARRTFFLSSYVDMHERLADLMHPRGKVVVENWPREISRLSVDDILDRLMPLDLHFRTSKKGKGDQDGYTGITVAATILARALTLADQGRPEIGIDKILEELGKEYKNEGIIGAGRDIMTGIWHNYRASAHISLAFLEMGPNTRPLEDPKVLFEWVARSMDLLRAGSSIGNRFAENILPKRECWSILWCPSLGG